MIINHNLAIKDSNSFYNSFYNKINSSDIIFISGPTASGKTMFAHKLANKIRGDILNIDSMQIYQDLKYITCSPEKDILYDFYIDKYNDKTIENNKKQIEYKLYNILSPYKELSSIKYSKLCLEEIKDTITKHNKPIIVGGTGLYIDTMINGYNLIPDIDQHIKIKTMEILQNHSIEYLYNELAKLDPKILDVKTIKPSDQSRIIRAYNVFNQTGKSITDYWIESERIKPLENYKIFHIMLFPEKELMYSLCNNRVITDIIDSEKVKTEITNFQKKYKNLNTTATKAIGLKDMILYLNNKISKQEAINNISLLTRRYAKRQITWFSKKVKYDHVINFSSQKELNDVISKLEL
ncbi:MAG TPA: tRNA (adenosine(37)-N6)-dimethylallyltransferase MiaA [Candidatus Megaira endosymbiont of Hartmannula sinica]|nr:tRNA (adenosine(37)-N6)-dimethylallyltransferase MiaA [Candidatus Megaera endosymbiont of Hartmannula sinica]